MSVGDFAAKVVRLVFEIREDESCFRCRLGLKWHERGYGWSAHHRRPKGSGGTSEEWVGQAANCLILCGSGTTGCHGWVESHRAKATELGLLVPRLGHEKSSEVPVCRLDGSWWWLTNWGSAVEIGEDVLIR